MLYRVWAGLCQGTFCSKGPAVHQPKLHAGVAAMRASSNCNNVQEGSMTATQQALVCASAARCHGSHACLSP